MSLRDHVDGVPMPIDSGDASRIGGVPTAWHRARTMHMPGHQGQFVEGRSVERPDDEEDRSGKA